MIEETLSNLSFLSGAPPGFEHRRFNVLLDRSNILIVFGPGQGGTSIEQVTWMCGGLGSVFDPKISKGCLLASKICKGCHFQAIEVYQGLKLL